MTTNANITTGTEYETDADTHQFATVYGYADDGEHAVVWGVEAAPEGEGEWFITVTYCEAGLCDRVDAMTERYDGMTDEEVARTLAEDDPESAVREARDYWTSK